MSKNLKKSNSMISQSFGRKSQYSVSINVKKYTKDIPYGLAVRIPGFHPGGPGSTPGMGTSFIGEK